MEALVQFILIFVNVYILCVFVWALLSWLPMISPGLAYNSGVKSAQSFLDSIVLPYIKLFKGIPPVRVGGAMVDLSAMAAIIVLILLANLVLPQLLGPLA